MSATINATVPLVAAVARTATVAYAEIVSSIPTRAAGPDIRAGIDHLIETTCAALEAAGARQAKVISLLSPADPPSIRDTVYCLVDGDADRRAIERGIHAAVARAGGDTPGFRLKQAVQFERIGPLRIPEIGVFAGTKVTALVEVATETTGFPT